MPRWKSDPVQGKTLTIKNAKWWTLMPQREAAPKIRDILSYFTWFKDDTVSVKKVTITKEAGNKQALKVVVALDSTVDQLVSEKSRLIRRILTTWRPSPWRTRWMTNCVRGT